MRYVSITFTITDATQADILIALLADAGFEGFEETGNSLKAFIKEADFDSEVVTAITANLNLPFTIDLIEQQNWNANWESSFEPVIINEFAAVRASFHAPVQQVKHEIIITPKMSFGTGHHATTYLMMEQMSGIDFTNKTVLDFGTGTGVLAILAEKMSAGLIMAVDNDDWSIENAIENINHNQCKNITIKKASAIESIQKYDVILANINLNVILANMPAIAAVCKQGCALLLSGFLVADESQVKVSLISNKLAFNRVSEKNGWICIEATTL